MTISLIITCRNEASNIGRLMNSVLKQRLQPDEMIIVDAGSIDGTIDIIREFMKTNSWIKLIIKDNVSRGKGRNIAISKAANQIIAVTDAGCYLEQDWLNNLVKPILQGNCDVAIGNYEPYYRNNFEFFEGLLLASGRIDIVRISSRSLAFKKSVWAKCGGYEEDVDVGEDTLFHWRFVKNGYSAELVNNAIVKWDMPKDTKDLFNKLFMYGRGYWQALGIKEFRRFLYLIAAFYLIILSLILSLALREFAIVVALLGLVFIGHLLLGISYFFRTYKKQSLFYVPYIFFMKNLAFILGFTFGKALKL